MAKIIPKRFRCPVHWTLAERVAHYTDKSGGPDACWPWLGGRDKDGYGVIWWDGTYKRVSRFVYEETYGPMQTGLLSRHKCDCPPCVNPSHLESGTSAQNTADMINRGRNKPRPGMACTTAKLSDELVREIRSTQGKQRHIADQFGINQSTVSRIKRGLRWHHLT